MHRVQSPRSSEEEGPDAGHDDDVASGKTIPCGAAPDGDETEQISVARAASHLLEECRMVLPGIQALFGFQLIAVFQASFDAKLDHGEQELHLVSTLLVALAAALVMAPAALRQTAAPTEIHAGDLRLISRLLRSGMVALAAGLSIDLYLMSRIVIGTRGLAAVLAAAVAVGYVVLWLVLPLWARTHPPARAKAWSSPTKTTA